jgi:hypothetical protein
MSVALVSACAPVSALVDSSLFGYHRRHGILSRMTLGVKGGCMSPATLKLHQSLIRLAKGMITAWEEGLRSQTGP